MNSRHSREGIDSLYIDVYATGNTKRNIHCETKGLIYERKAPIKMNRNKHHEKGKRKGYVASKENGHKSNFFRKIISTKRKYYFTLIKKKRENTFFVFIKCFLGREHVLENSSDGAS